MPLPRRAKITLAPAGKQHGMFENVSQIFADVLHVYFQNKAVSTRCFGHVLLPKQRCSKIRHFPIFSSRFHPPAGETPAVAIAMRLR